MLSDLDAQLLRVRQHLLGGMPRSIEDRGVYHFERGEIEKAFACLSQAAEWRSQDARVYAYLAFICARKGLEREAEDFIAHALKLNPAQQAYRAALGESFLKAGHAAAAAHHLQLALDAQPDMVAAYPALVESHRRLHDYERAIGLLNHALTLSQSKKQQDMFQAMLAEIHAEVKMHAHNPLSLEKRTALLPYCSSHELNKFATPSNRTNDRIWQYWGQGENAGDMPAIVRACLISVKRHAGNRQVVVLDDSTLDDYVQVPACIRKFQYTDRTHFSDWLRVALLERYGGTWIDATVFLSGPIDDKILHADFFAFSRPDLFLLSNWFLHAVPHHPLIEGLKFSLEQYWENNTTIIDYFLFHFLFEALTTLHPRLHQQWLDAPRISFSNAHEMGRILAEKFDPQKFADITARSNIHKLSYKRDNNNPNNPPCQTFHDFFAALGEKSQ
ncbi:MAG: hypothetical protein LBB76_03030 [Azoarcus sp.]|jgi:tetratricopeptide (TPR) repeat protein|nr:hypothetical protein [Azoarcus sp.]